jgi:hypothetical protein
MNEPEYEKLTKDIKQYTQKIANDIFNYRKTIIIRELQARGLELNDTVGYIKKGRPKNK